MIKAINFSYKKFNFPVGELQVQIETHTSDPIEVVFSFENNEEIIELLLVNNALNNFGLKINHLFMPYVPYSRQDRINEPGECFSLKVFCQLINSMNVETVHIMDPHSEVTTALLDRLEVLEQHQAFAHYLVARQNFYLISPDGGALKKIYKLQKRTNSLGVIECSKYRDTMTGEVKGVIVHADHIDKDCVIVDDICDGGRTFIEIAKVLKQKGAKKITLMVTHGFFTKGLEVFDGLIDEIYTNKGKVL